MEGDDDDVEAGQGDVEAGGQDLSDSDNNNNDRCDAFQMLGAFWRLRGDVIGMIFRSKNGCETAGSAGNDTEEEEVPGRELPSQGQGGCDYEVQGGCEVQGSIQDKKGLVNVFNLSLCRLL